MAGRDDVEVKFGANISDVERGVAGVERELKNLNGAVSNISRGFQNIFRAAVIEEAARAIGNFVQSMAELGDLTEDTAAQLGATVERVGELQYIAESSGDSLQSLALGMQRLAYNSQKAISGSEMEADAFARMGVSVKDAAGNVKSIDQLLTETADSFAAHADGPEKVALAMQLLGRAGVNMIPILNMGGAEMARLAEVAQRTGSVMSGATVAGIMQVHQSLTEANASMRGLGIQIFNVFQPAINGLIKTFSQFVQWLTNGIQRSYEQGGAMRYLAEMANVVAAAVMTIVAAFQILWDVASGIIKTLTTAMVGLGKGLYFAVTGNFTAMVQASNEAGAAILKTWQDTGGDIKDLLGQYTENIKALWAGIPQTTGTTMATPAKLPFASPADISAAKQALSQLKSQLQEVQSIFEGVFSNIIGGFDRAISGLISGTMDWKQALMTVADSIWSTFIKLIEDWVAKWLAGEATMLIAHQTSNAAKVASDLAAQSTASAEMIAAAIKAILIDSKQTFGGVFANLSPTLGPAAAIPAGAAAATVAGMASFDVGSWRVPRDQVAQIHEGETILPAKEGIADMFRSMMAGGGGKGGGGNPVNFYGPVMDREALARTVVSVLKRNPSMRGDW